MISDLTLLFFIQCPSSSTPKAGLALLYVLQLLDILPVVMCSKIIMCLFASPSKNVNLGTKTLPVSAQSYLGR